MTKNFSVNFFKRFSDDRIAYRSMHAVPRIGDKCVFEDKRYLVAIVEWCMDLDATTFGAQRINIELEEIK